MATLFWLAVFIGGAIALLYKRTALKNFAIATGIALVVYSLFGNGGFLCTALLWLLLFLPQVLLLNDDLRKQQLTRRALAFYRKIAPKMSETERDALEAGTVWWEGDLFSGMPDWQRLLATPAATLTEREQAFLDGPCTELCNMIDEWDISHNRAEVPEAVWSFVKEQGFLGMIIPQSFGGLEFSPFAQSQVLMRVGSVSPTLATMIAVPNSLGPGELLLKYGTDAQKEQYLPGLANGTEIPCFGLTAPTAGSDATSIPDTGIVCMGKPKGKRKEVLGIRLTFSKRYITLAPIATLVGLAFKLQDPDGLLGDEKKTDYGITCALVPASTAGIDIGKRHYPLGSAWPNGPIRGEEVFVPMDAIIGGPERAGQGWRMLVECLSVGRAVSLPSSGTITSLHSAVASGAYARLREQFGMPIGEFEGISQVLGRLGGRAWAIDAARVMTLASIAQGEKPSVAGAIMKYHATETGRASILDAMDIHGGKAIMHGPSNYLYRNYQEAPIAITVEGANILTRNMIIYGQGAIRCHPYVLKEMRAADLADEKQRLDEFDDALFGHLGLTLTNTARAFALGLTAGRVENVPVSGATRGYFQQFSRWSAVLAVCSDAAMATLGGKLKFKESLSARLGDLLAYLYIGSAVLKRHEERGQPIAELPMVEWACEWLLAELQHACDGFLLNLPNRPAAAALRLICLPLGRRHRGPSDKLNAKVAKLLQEPSAVRDRLTDVFFLEDNGIHATGSLNAAYQAMLDVQPLRDKIRQAERTGMLETRNLDHAATLKAAVKEKIITRAEAKKLTAAQEALMKVINVDEFSSEELARNTA